MKLLPSTGHPLHASLIVTFFKNCVAAFIVAVFSQNAPLRVAFMASQSIFNTLCSITMFDFCQRILLKQRSISVPVPYVFQKALGFSNNISWLFSKALLAYTAACIYSDKRKKKNNPYLYNRSFWHSYSGTPVLAYCHFQTICPALEQKGLC